VPSNSAISAESGVTARCAARHHLSVKEPAAAFGGRAESPAAVCAIGRPPMALRPPSMPSREGRGDATTTRVSATSGPAPIAVGPTRANATNAPKAASRNSTFVTCMAATTATMDSSASARATHRVNRPRTTAAPPEHLEQSHDRRRDDAGREASRDHHFGRPAESGPAEITASFCRPSTTMNQPSLSPPSANYATPILISFGRISSAFGRLTSSTPSRYVALTRPA
jgi:hypothetical protein